MYTSAAKVQELAREYTFSTWRKSEGLGARDAPVKGPPAAHQATRSAGVSDYGASRFEFGNVF